MITAEIGSGTLLDTTLQSGSIEWLAGEMLRLANPVSYKRKQVRFRQIMRKRLKATKTSKSLISASDEPG